MYKQVVSNEMLHMLGFKGDEIKCLYYMLNARGKLSSPFLSNLGYSYQEIKRLQYLYAIAIGKTVINTKDVEAISKHFRKLNTDKEKININNLPLSKDTNVLTLGVVQGVPKGSYDLYNYSCNKKGPIHKISNIGKELITIETTIKPVLAYGSEKCLYYCKDKDSNKMIYSEEVKKINSFRSKANDIIVGKAVEVKRLSKDKKLVDIAFDKRYVRLLTPYVIVCSFTRPESHLGRYRLVLHDGTKLFIYAMRYERKNKIVNNSSRRVYYWGYNKKQLASILKEIAEKLYIGLAGVFVEFQQGEEYSPFK